MPRSHHTCRTHRTCARLHVLGLQPCHDASPHARAPHDGQPTGAIRLYPAQPPALRGGAALPPSNPIHTGIGQLGPTAATCGHSSNTLYIGLTWPRLNRCFLYILMYCTVPSSVSHPRSVQVLRQLMIRRVSHPSSFAISSLLSFLLIRFRHGLFLSSGT